LGNTIGGWDYCIENIINIVKKDNLKEGNKLKANFYVVLDDILKNTKICLETWRGHIYLNRFGVVMGLSVMNGNQNKLHSEVIKLLMVMQEAVQERNKQIRN